MIQKQVLRYCGACDVILDETCFIHGSRYLRKITRLVCSECHDSDVNVTHQCETFNESDKD